MKLSMRHLPPLPGCSGLQPPDAHGKPLSVESRWLEINGVQVKNVPPPLLSAERQPSGQQPTAVSQSRLLSAPRTSSDTHFRLLFFFHNKTRFVNRTHLQSNWSVFGIDGSYHLLERHCQVSFYHTIFYFRIRIQFIVGSFFFHTAVKTSPLNGESNKYRRSIDKK